MTKRQRRRDRHRFCHQKPAPQPQFTINIDMRHFVEKIDALTKALASAAPAIAEAGRQMSERFAQMGNRLYYSPGSHYVGLGSQMQQIAIDAERQDRAIAGVNEYA